MAGILDHPIVAQVRKLGYKPNIETVLNEDQNR